MNPDDYVSAAEAARMLGVSRQRVSQMIHTGALPGVHPWPRAVRVPRAAIDAWVAGERPKPIHRTAARQYVLFVSEAGSIDMIDRAQLAALCRQFATERRPEWGPGEVRRWADKMADNLLANAGSPRP